MTITALFRDFLISKKAKQKFEKNFLKLHPEFKREDGGFDWSNNRYGRYILSRCRSTSAISLTINDFVGLNCANHTFRWLYTDEGDEFWFDIHQSWHDYLIELGYDYNSTIQGFPGIEKGKTEV